MEAAGKFGLICPQFICDANLGDSSSPAEVNRGPSLPRRPPIDVDRLPGNPLAALRRKEQAHLGHLVAVAGIAERNHVEDFLLPRFAASDVIHAVGVDDAPESGVPARSLKAKYPQRDCMPVSDRIQCGL